MVLKSQIKNSQPNAFSDNKNKNLTNQSFLGTPQPNSRITVLKTKIISYHHNKPATIIHHMNDRHSSKTVPATFTLNERKRSPSKHNDIASLTSDAVIDTSNVPKANLRTPKKTAIMLSPSDSKEFTHSKKRKVANFMSPATRQTIKSAALTDSGIKISSPSKKITLHGDAASTLINSSAMVPIKVFQMPTVLGAN